MAWRSNWKSVEPKPPIGGVHTYRWTNLDNAVAAAEAAGKQSTIRVMGGDYTPAWVQPQVTYVNTHGTRRADPIMWDASYLTPYCQLIAAFCQRYGSDSRVAWIVMAGCGMSDEMIIGWSKPVNVWQSSVPPPNGCGSATYTSAGFVAGWTRCIDTYRANLPTTMRSALCFDEVGHGTPGNPMFAGTETDSILAHCDRIGSTVMVQNNGLHRGFSTNMTGTTMECLTWQDIVNRNTKTTVGWQTVKDGSSSAQMQGAMTAAVQSGASYVEVYPQDSCNAALVPAYESFLAA
jgi:hypothetical protein